MYHSFYSVIINSHLEVPIACTLQWHCKGAGHSWVGYKDGTCHLMRSVDILKLRKVSNLINEKFNVYLSCTRSLRSNIPESIIILLYI